MGAACDRTGADEATRAAAPQHVKSAAAHAPRVTHAAGGGMPPLLALAVAAALLCAALLWRSRLTQPLGAQRTMVVLGSGACG